MKTECLPYIGGRERDFRSPSRSGAETVLHGNCSNVHGTKCKMTSIPSMEHTYSTKDLVEKHNDRAKHAQI